MRRFLEAYVSKLEKRVLQGDQLDYYEHLKGADVEKKPYSSQYIRGRKVKKLGDVNLIRMQRVE